MAEPNDPRAGAMEGHGFYTEHSQAQEAYGELGFEWLEQAAAEVDPPADPLPFVIADMGAAGGGNSLEPMRRALAARQGGGPALVVHTDIPGNDFTALFELLADSPHTYLGEPGVFAAAEGKSFYEPLFPAGFLSLGWSSIAVHWLSSVPQPIPGHIYCSFAGGEVRDRLRERSAADWRDFLAARASELRSSGRLVVVGGAALDDGSSGAEGLMAMANAALGDLVDGGQLERAEYERMTIPTWNRTTAEFVEPFEAGAASGLELRRHAARSLPDPYLAKFREDGNLDAYAESVAGFFRAAFGDSLWAALEDPSRTAAVEAAFDGLLRKRIAADPEAASCRWHVVVLDIAAA
jgi:hypothetical protein